MALERKSPINGSNSKSALTFSPGWDQSARALDSFTDARDIQRELKEQGLNIENEIDESSTGPASLMVTDPDGNTVLIDQHV